MPLDSRRKPREPVRIVPYRGYGDGRVFRLRGRVMEDEGIVPAGATDGRWRNVQNMIRRFETDEVPRARITATLLGGTAEAVADGEGFFEVTLQPATPVPPGEAWHAVELRLLSPLREGEPPPTATGYVLSPPASARRIVVSDLDDTVIRTDVLNPLRMAGTVFLGNARTRMPFPGVPALYKALQDGEGGEGNPIFYLSSSPWNLYDVLTEFLDLHEVPRGPVLLRDWGIAPRNLPFGNREHKLAGLRGLLELFPSLPFVLIGDSGQEDPEIYAELVHVHKDRVRAVYIRSIDPDPRRVAGIQALAEEVLRAGSALVLAEDTLAAARHAVGHGLIQARFFPELAAEVAADREETAAAPETVVIAPTSPAAATAVLAAGSVEAAVTPPADGSPAPAVVVEGAAAGDPPSARP